MKRQIELLETRRKRHKFLINMFGIRENTRKSGEQEKNVVKKASN